MGKPNNILVIFSLIFLTGCGKKLGYDVDKKNNQVIWRTWDAGSLYQEKVVNGADAETFQRIKIKPNLRFRHNSFGKDKAHVYWQGNLVEGADPKTFEEFGNNEYYRYRDANRIFIFDEMEGFIPLKGSDAKTFKVLDDVWARDSRQAYWYNVNFVPRDISSFEVLRKGYWAQDKKAFYWGYREVKGINRKAFKFLNDKYYYFTCNNKNLFWQGWVVEGVDPDAFIIETSNSGHDDKFLYQFKENYKENGKDAATYRMLVTKTPRSDNE